MRMINGNGMMSLELKTIIHYDDLVDDQHIRETNSLYDIYERSNVVVFETAGYEEAKMNQNLKNAIKVDLIMTEKNQTWTLVEIPQDRKVIGVKWIFWEKLNRDSPLNKHKSRLLVRSYAQV